jgi:hypothetical protein
VQWVRRFILFHCNRHPKEMGADEIPQSLSHLASDGQVSASTQNRAASAILFLYRQVLGLDLPFVEGVERAKRPARLPSCSRATRRVPALPHVRHTPPDGLSALRVGAAASLIDVRGVVLRPSVDQTV